MTPELFTTLGNWAALLLSPIGALAYWRNERLWSRWLPRWRRHWCSGGWVVYGGSAAYDLWFGAVWWSGTLLRVAILVCIIGLHWRNFKDVMLRQFGVRVAFPGRIIRGRG